jgi:hypothetical protein
MTANSRGLIYDLNVTEIRSIVLTHARELAVMSRVLGLSSSHES